MAVVRRRVAVYAGEIESQPLVFAHLLDEMPGLDLDHVDVICGVDPQTRLAHALPPAQVAAVEDALGLYTTVVLIFSDAIPAGQRLPTQTERLTWLGSFDGLRHRPAPS